MEFGSNRVSDGKAVIMTKKISIVAINGNDASVNSPVFTFKTPQTVNMMTPTGGVNPPKLINMTIKIPIWIGS